MTEFWTIVWGFVVAKLILNLFRAFAMWVLGLENGIIYLRSIKNKLTTLNNQVEVSNQRLWAIEAQLEEEE